MVVIEIKEEEHYNGFQHEVNYLQDQKHNAMMGISFSKLSFEQANTLK